MLFIQMKRWGPWLTGLPHVFVHLCQLFFSWFMLVALKQMYPSRAGSFVRFPDSTWELEGHISSLPAYKLCDSCAAPTNVTSYVGTVSAASRQVLQRPSHHWLCFIWAQMVGTVVCLSILWLPLCLPKAQLSIAESAFTIDTSVKYRQRWLSWWYENIGPNAGNHIVTVNAIIEMKTLKSND